LATRLLGLRARVSTEHTHTQAAYHIHLTSKSSVNKATAKATLGQMVAVVFQRLEAYVNGHTEATQACSWKKKKTPRSSTE